MQAKPFFSRGKFLDQKELAALSLTKSFPFWAYLQLKHYLDNPASREKLTKPPTVFESLCLGPPPQRHMISTLYASMFRDSRKILQTEYEFWKTQLNIEIPEASWELIHLYIHKGSLNVNTQENGYKIKTQWYKTPEILHNFIPSVSDRCWRCGQERGTFFHVWWECPQIQPYWRKVHDVTMAVSSLPLEFVPAQYLLHHSKNFQEKIL